MKLYTYQKHLHNFSVWTAARASQRGFTSTANIKKAIDSSCLQEFSLLEAPLSEADFESFHRRCCNQLIASLDELIEQRASYGRAAKIVAIYLKTSVILLGQGLCSRSAIIHPPIDAILLNGLRKHTKLQQLKQYKWTQMDEEQYWNLISIIKQTEHRLDWTLEVFWHPELEQTQDAPNLGSA